MKSRLSASSSSISAAELTPCLKLKNLSFTLPTGLQLLKEINAEISPGEFVVLMGSNGSGKSTLMKMINRQYCGRQGQIFLNGKDIYKFKKNIFLKEVITLTQFVRESLFLDLTVLDNAKLIAGVHSACELESYLKDFNKNLIKAIHRPASELSGGEQQQLAFALYLTHKPSLLLLDEHTSALDPKTAEKIMQMTSDYVKTHQITCLMTTHNLNFAERFGDRHWVMEEGRLIKY
jgi:putative ABC transport system ATP-binding protein